MSNWHIWCRAVVKTEEGPLLHFCICWSGLSCNSLHSNNCQIFAKILLKISFEYLTFHFVFFVAPDVDRRPPGQQLLGICKKKLPNWHFFKNIILSTKKRRKRYTLFFDEGMGYMNALREQNVQIRRKFKFSVKFVFST